MKQPNYINFTDSLFLKTITGEKTTTRRIKTTEKPKYRTGETIYIKEPSREFIDRKNIPAFSTRYFIKITGVRAERLQDITAEDCIKEGIEEVLPQYGFDNIFYTYAESKEGFETPQNAYASLINLIYGKGTWESNPFVWVYDYELI